MQKAFHHPNQQKGWEYNAPKPGYNKGQYTDEDVDVSLANHTPLWRYVLYRFPYDKTPDALTGKKTIAPYVNIIGYRALPVGIELSQWDYNVNFISDSLEIINKAKKDCEIQAGFMDKFYYANSTFGVPETHITAFLGVLDELNDEYVVRYLKLLKKSSIEVITQIDKYRNWRRILKNFDYEIRPYPDGIRGLLIIRGYKD